MSFHSGSSIKNKMTFQVKTSIWNWFFLLFYFRNQSYISSKTDKRKACSGAPCSPRLAEQTPQETQIVSKTTFKNNFFFIQKMFCQEDAGSGANSHHPVKIKGTSPIHPQGYKGCTMQRGHHLPQGCCTQIWPLSPWLSVEAFTWHLTPWSRSDFSSGRNKSRTKIPWAIYWRNLTSFPCPFCSIYIKYYFMRYKNTLKAIYPEALQGLFLPAAKTSQSRLNFSPKGHGLATR